MHVLSHYNSKGTLIILQTVSPAPIIGIHVDGAYSAPCHMSNLRIDKGSRCVFRWMYLHTFNDTDVICVIIYVLNKT